MPLQLEYQLGPASYLAHRRFVDQGVPKGFLKGYLSWCALVGGVCLLGTVAAYLAQSLVLGMAFFGVLAGIAFHAASYKRHYEAAIRAAAASLPIQTVRLLIDEQGLYETVAGVSSFAPWSAVVCYAFASDTLLLQLASGHWSLVPVSALGVTGDLADCSLVALLQQKSIAKFAG